MGNELEYTIIANILYSAEYATKVIPYLKKEYFAELGELAEEISKFFGVYGSIPTKKELIIEVQNRKGIPPKRAAELTEIVKKLEQPKEHDVWLISRTEKFFQERAIVNAVIESADIMDSHPKDSGKIIDLVKNALAVSFDNSIGLDYFKDIDRRYEMYHRVEDKISWGIKALDEVTNGGISKKNLVCGIAPTGSGKSLFMCSIASNVVRQGQNVLYITMEMSEERVAERIDANLFGESIDRIRNMEEVRYKTLAEDLRQKTMGRLIIREYPTSGANANHFRKLLTELKNKQQFEPDLVVVDYLNICTSSRFSPANTNSYGLIKAISEELRGLAVEFNCAVLTATQTNRGGIQNSDLEMTDISESIGTAFVLDFMFAIIRTETLDEQNQILIKQLKNRYGDLTLKQSFTLGIDRPRMCVYDLDSNWTFNNPQTFASPLPKRNSPKPAGMDLSRINV